VGVVASASPLAKKSKIEEAEFAKIPLIIKTGKVLRQISAKGIKLNVVMQCDSLETMLAAVRGGLGVGVLYRDIAQPSLSKGDLKRLEIPMLNQLNIFCHIAWRRDSYLSQGGKALLEILRSRKEISQKKPFHEKTRLISPR
jgi:DNA-binding transcriptional LysR family regulator